MDKMFRDLEMHITYAILKVEQNHSGKFDVRNPDAIENVKKLQTFKEAISSLLAQDPFSPPHDK